MATKLWKRPCLRTKENSEEERRATWLELFYDLVFVVAIAELSHLLEKDVSPYGLFSFIILFIPVWWSWVGATFYATRFDTDDLRDRLLTLLQMSIVAILAVHVHHGLEESSVGFALSYASIRTILVLQYFIAGHYLPIARPLTTRYIQGFGIDVILWIVSIFVPIPWRFALWVLGLIISFGTPLTAGKFVAQLPPSFSHVPERLGLFTIIVLGESVAAVVRGVSEIDWSIAPIMTAFLGVSIAFSLWWLYFENIDASPLGMMKAGRMQISLSWLYAHLPLAMGLAATGIGVEKFVIGSAEGELYPRYRWLLCGAVALCLLVLAFIHQMAYQLGTRQQDKTLRLYRLGVGIFILVLATAGNALSPVVLIALVAVACALQVVLDLLLPQPSKV